MNSKILIAVAPGIAGGFAAPCPNRCFVLAALPATETRGEPSPQLEEFRESLIHLLKFVVSQPQPPSPTQEPDVRYGVSWNRGPGAVQDEQPNELGLMGATIKRGGGREQVRCTGVNQAGTWTCLRWKEGCSKHRGTPQAWRLLSASASGSWTFPADGWSVPELESVLPRSITNGAEPVLTDPRRLALRRRHHH